MREEKIIVDGINVYLDDGVRKWASARRPYYRLRGKRVTEQQAFEIIRRADTFFSWYLKLDGHYEECIRDLNFNMWWFASNHCPEKYGWIHPSGVVGLNGITQKYPTVNEFIEEWSTYIRNFPFLDLVIGVTCWDEQCPERWEEHGKIYKLPYKEFKEQSNILDFIDLERRRFEEAVELGIWVHDGIIEIMNAERAVEVYLRYEKQYEEQNRRIYMPEYYSNFQPDIVTRNYLHRCLAAYGIADPEKLIQEKTSPYQTENLKDDIYSDNHNSDKDDSDIERGDKQSPV